MSNYKITYHKGSIQVDNKHGGAMPYLPDESNPLFSSQAGIDELQNIIDAVEKDAESRTKGKIAKRLFK